MTLGELMKKHGKNWETQTENHSKQWQLFHDYWDREFSKQGFRSELLEEMDKQEAEITHRHKQEVTELHASNALEAKEWEKLQIRKDTAKHVGQWVERGANEKDKLGHSQKSIFQEPEVRQPVQEPEIETQEKPQYAPVKQIKEAQSNYYQTKQDINRNANVLTQEEIDRIALETTELFAQMRKDKEKEQGPGIEHD
jgi:hypothetical protein